jgi:FdhD protein
MSDKFGIQPVEIIRYNLGKKEDVLDSVSVEEPLEIRISGQQLDGPTSTKQTTSEIPSDSVTSPIVSGTLTSTSSSISSSTSAVASSTTVSSKALSITMRTPGNDQELAAGFLFTEGIISDASEILGFQESSLGDTLTVELRNFDAVDVRSLDRHFYTTSSCGVCGKSSIDAVKTQCKIALAPENLKISASQLLEFPELLRKQQSAFDFTGGIHACALFSADGKLHALREDVGRHNALDKLIGSFLIPSTKSMGSGEATHSGIPLTNYVLLLSGRASFELVQKAGMAGIRCIAAVGAPSSLAIDLAEELGITLVGFLRQSRFNIYAHPHRIQL